MGFKALCQFLFRTHTRNKIDVKRWISLSSTDSKLPPGGTSCVSKREKKQHSHVERKDMVVFCVNLSRFARFSRFCTCQLTKHFRAAQFKNVTKLLFLRQCQREIEFTLKYLNVWKRAFPNT